MQASRGTSGGLQRCDIDVAAGTVRIRQAFVEQRGVGLALGPPKSRAGVRTIALPSSVIPALKQHMGTHVGKADDAFVFTGESGRTVWRGKFNKLVKWAETVEAVGAPGLHFHDLRHTGNTLASRRPGASLRDLMARMGHDTPGRDDLPARPDQRGRSGDRRRDEQGGQGAPAQAEQAEAKTATRAAPAAKAS